MNMTPWNIRESRRSFLRLGCAGILGLGHLSWLRGAGLLGESPLGELPLREPPRAKSMILMWLGGGPATIDMWDMKPDAPVEVRGEFLPIATSVGGMQISEHLPKLAKVMNRCTLIRSLSHGIPDHGPGAQFVMTGNKPSPVDSHPSLGALAARLSDKNAAPLPPYITMGRPASSGAGYLGSAYNPFELSANRPGAEGEMDGLSLPKNMTTAELERRAELRRAFDASFIAADDALAKNLSRLQNQSLEFLRTDRIRQAIDRSSEKAPVVESYGSDELGTNTLIARRLIEHGAHFVTVGTDGWDTHQNNFATLRGQLLPRLDRALSALINDLDERGMLDETVVCCLGEFGRTPQINGNAGRDHWSRAMSVLVAGGGVKRGFIHGATDPAGREPVSAACTPADLATTLMTLVGVDTTQRVSDISGRSRFLFAEGTVIRAIIG